MAREVWGTYSVKDHLYEHAWAADVILYDRLVIPVPYELDDGADWRRWEAKGWDPARQKALLAVLGDRAYPVSWDPNLQEQWRSEWRDALSRQVNLERGRPVDAFQQSAMVLQRNLPSRVTAVSAVATYRSSEELSTAVSMRRLGANEPLPVGQGAVVIGREFLIPDPDQCPDDVTLLAKAVEVASDADFKRRRTAYWRWQREFLRDGDYLDADSINASVEEMQDLIADEHRVLRHHKIRFVTLFALCVASAGLGLAAGAAEPVPLATAFLSVGQFVAGEALQVRSETDPPPASLLIAGKKELGWD